MSETIGSCSILFPAPIKGPGCCVHLRRNGSLLWSPASRQRSFLSPSLSMCESKENSCDVRCHYGCLSNKAILTKTKHRSGKSTNCFLLKNATNGYRAGRTWEQPLICHSTGLQWLAWPWRTSYQIGGFKWPARDRGFQSAGEFYACL